jgi:hypothetical protein
MFAAGYIWKFKERAHMLAFDAEMLLFKGWRHYALCITHDIPASHAFIF